MALGSAFGRAAFELAFTGDTRGLQRAFDRAGRSVTAFSGETEKHRKGLGKYASTLKTGVIGAIAGVGLFLGDSAKKAAEAETAQAKLVTQLRAAGISWHAHKDQIDKVITSTANLSGITDTELKAAFTNIVRVTGDHPGGLKRALDLTSLAADIARAKHIDVARAGELLGKVAGGNTGILKRYGIQIEKGATSTEALGLLQHKFAGQAKAYGETAQGAQDRFRVAVDRLQVVIGTKLLPVLTALINAAVYVVNHVDDVRRAIVNAARDTVRWVGDMPEHISTAIKASPGLLLDAGKFILTSIWDGLKQTPKIIADAAGWLKDQLIDAVKKAFGIGGGGGGANAQAFTGPNRGGLRSTGVPGFAAGGDFIVNGPTMFNAGGAGYNGGGERVTITPLTRPNRMTGASDVQIIMQQPSFVAPGHVNEFGRKLAFRMASR